MLSRVVDLVFPGERSPILCQGEGRPASYVVAFVPP